MVPTVFFGLLCLGPLSVIGDDLSWLPDTIPWPAQQCIDAGSVFDGECVVSVSIAPEVRDQVPFYRYTSPCSGLKCALPRPSGGHILFRRGRPKDGTPCGPSKVCRGGLCIAISPHKTPTRTGVRTTHDCRPPNMMPKRTDNNNDNSNGSSQQK